MWVSLVPVVELEAHGAPRTRGRAACWGAGGGRHHVWSGPFAHTSKIMPAGLIAALSIARSCRILCRAFSPPGPPCRPMPPAKQ
ncbi:hypothetical protein MRX96_012694 [Rhipicephalus microplus]